MRTFQDFNAAFNLNRKSEVNQACHFSKLIKPFLHFLWDLGPAIIFLFRIELRWHTWKNEITNKQQLINTILLVLLRYCSPLLVFYLDSQDYNILKDLTSFREQLQTLQWKFKLFTHYITQQRKLLDSQVNTDALITYYVAQ